LKEIEGDSPDGDGSPTSGEVIKIRNDSFIELAARSSVQSSPGLAPIQNPAQTEECRGYKGTSAAIGSRQPRYSAR
jgi:hypothetical protein